MRRRERGGRFSTGRWRTRRISDENDQTLRAYSVEIARGAVERAAHRSAAKRRPSIPSRCLLRVVVRVRGPFRPLQRAPGQLLLDDLDGLLQLRVTPLAP